MIPFKKILCPIDFSEPSYEALKAANELALHFSAELCLIHVVSLVPILPASPDPAAFNVPLYQEELEASSKKSLQEAVEKRISKGLHAYQIVVEGDAAYQIVRIAQEENAELIVMATHGQTGWRRLIFGSVAAKVIRLATCPVLTIHAPHEEG